jgi:hypothetical protein
MSDKRTEEASSKLKRQPQENLEQNTDRNISKHATRRAMNSVKQRNEATRKGFRFGLRTRQT